MSVRRKNQSSFSFELENLTSKLAKIAEETVEIAQSTFMESEDAGLRWCFRCQAYHNHGQLKFKNGRYYCAKKGVRVRQPLKQKGEKWYQTAIGVNETLALAQKLGVSPWDLTEKRSKKP